jgi:hypothetical protein
MCGAGSEVSRGEQRKQLLSERDQRIVQFMKERLSVAHIADLEGIEEDYARKATRRLAAQEGIEYNPAKETSREILTDASRQFRIGMAKIVSELRDAPGAHPLEIARDTGLTQAAQVAATQRAENSNVGYTHDYKLSQLERIAATRGDDFRRMMLRALLTREEWLMVAKCLSN